jgi:hypothetical protein
VLQVATEPKPNAQPAEQGPAKKTAPAKPTEVGAIWSNPGAPDAFGGRRVKPARPQDVKLMATVRAGHYFLNDAPNTTRDGIIAAPRAGGVR